MDWPGSRTTQGLDQLVAEEEMDDGEEDFYGLGSNTNGNDSESHAVLGASNQVGALLSHREDQLTSAA